METFDPQPEFNVQDAEYLRLLGYPRGHEPGAGPREETIAGDSQSQLGLTCTNAPDCPPSDDSRPVGSSLLGPRPTEVHG